MPTPPHAVQVRGRRGRKGNREWELRNRLTRDASRMSGDHVSELQRELMDLPAKIGVPILAAWNAKENLLDLLALARTYPAREDIADLLYRFYHRCAGSDLPELERWIVRVRRRAGSAQPHDHADEIVEYGRG